MAEERLQKILARAGVASRRKAEEIIQAGRVRVDGRVVKELGSKADPKRARVELDGRRLEPEPLCYGILHKPRGMVTTLSDPEGRPTARDILKQVGVRVVPVGRLDFNTSGALLFTNDGDFAQAIAHARGNVPKVYAAKVQQPVDEASLKKWCEAIDIEGRTTRPADVRILRREADKTWLEVVIQEGRNRQVRRLGDHAGTPVVRLARLSHAEIDTEGLRPGQWRLLTVDELKNLKKRYGVPEKIRGAMTYKGEISAVVRPRVSRPKSSKTGQNDQRSSASTSSRQRAPRGQDAQGVDPARKDPVRAGRYPFDAGERAGRRRPEVTKLGSARQGAGRDGSLQQARESGHKPGAERMDPRASGTRGRRSQGRTSRDAGGTALRGGDARSSSSRSSSSRGVSSGSGRRSRR